METSFEYILSSLLEDYDNNPNQNINVLIEKHAQKMGLSEESKALLAETNEYIDAFDEKATSLAKAKEERGISRKHWMLEEIDVITEGRTEEERAAVATALSNAEEEILNQTLTKE